jgi:hypothetical protein
VLLGERLSNLVAQLMDGSDEQFDNAPLMRVAGRFSRRVRGFAEAHHIPVIDCRQGGHKHDIAEEYQASHSVTRGLFLILVARAIAPVRDVRTLFGTKSVRTGTGNVDPGWKSCSRHLCMT